MFKEGLNNPAEKTRWYESFNVNSIAGYFSFLCSQDEEECTVFPHSVCQFHLRVAASRSSMARGACNSSLQPLEGREI